MTAKKRVKRTPAAAADGMGPNAQTIVYIHGIGNKPTEAVLRCKWDKALMDFGLGERSRMAYWCQADRHGPPTSEPCGTPDLLDAESVGSPGLGARSMVSAQDVDRVIADVAQNEAELASLERLKNEMQPEAPGTARRLGAAGVQAEGLEDIDAPDFLTRFVTALFLKDVRDFFFDKHRRERMKQSLRDRLITGGGPFVVVAHSQGSMIAYSTLLDLAQSGIHVPLFVTIGSPLGLAEVRDQIRKIHGLSKKQPLRAPECVGEWQNYFDRKDRVSWKTGVTEFYKAGAKQDLQDTVVENPDRKRDPHSATGYLSLPLVRHIVRSAVDLQRFQQVAPFKLAADAVADFESRPRGERRPLLIELTDTAWARQQHATMIADAMSAEAKRIGKRSVPGTAAEMAEELTALIMSIVDKDATSEDVDLRLLRRYVAARLTRSEAERLASSKRYEEIGLALPPLYRIWRNARKVALLETSVHTVQASAAHHSYQALGQGVQWAVLDSGCTAHPHFRKYQNIVERYDCTLNTDEPARESDPGHDRRARFDDLYGHGTHVCGIIAGAYDVPGAAGRTIAGIAPRAKLHSYRVLNQLGEGEDAWIIKALDHIASTNERTAGPPVIAGVNLSLGGPFEQDVFGCGHTPLCDELRRLWNQGVVVVIAAGNEGFARLMSSEGELSANMPFSIGDPANLEEAIAVGAIHKERPFTYGVSHFSSRGPTADGRAKPDCVAPGEQILSCRHVFARGARSARDLYVKLDGTSMAAPHVSGMIACFLSRRREFLGYPDRVKRILLENATDLGRDRQLQGAGLPNLVRMLVQT